MASEENSFEVVIIGGGVVGTALLYVLSNFTDIPRISLIEKEESPAEINSHHTNNSQTLHFGDIETNYSIEKAREVKEGAEMVAGYLEKNDPENKLHDRRSKMVLAVGEDEVEKLEERYDEEGFGELYNKLRKIRREKLVDIEPKVVEGRDPGKELLALQTPDGYVVDYGELSESFIEESNKDRTEVSTGEEVRRIERTGEKYTVETGKRELEAETVAVCAGSHSLQFAKDMGYGQNVSLLPVAGSFFLGDDMLNGKVYTLQMKKLPFAAVHGDADVHDPSITRFGPTAKLVPTLERGRYSTVFDFLDTFGFSLQAFLSYLNVLYDRILFPYVVRNIIYEIPYVGRLAFLPNVQKVVPSVGFHDIERAEGYGGVRPQIVDTENRELDMGEAKIVKDDIIFNITPSPGASTCLENARRDAEKLVEFLGGEYRFNREELIEETRGHFPRS